MYAIVLVVAVAAVVDAFSFVVANLPPFKVGVPLLNVVTSDNEPATLGLYVLSFMLKCVLTYATTATTLYQHSTHQ